MARLRLDSVTKRFDDVVAVDDISLEINDGEFLVLVGPSGCGKSTTLRMVAGLESVTDGEIELDGRRLTGRRPEGRDIAMVFQSYALYPHMTVEENMAFGLEESTNLSSEVIDEKVGTAAEMLNIQELLDRKPSELSGGQRQRVALGRAIVREPSAFLMDEPLSNLDAKLRAEMRTELQRIQEDLDTTTVYVTHDQTEAMTMGDRIAVLDDGTLQQVGTPLEVYHAPANRFVAGFMGEPSMNFFQMEVQGDRLVGEDLAYPLSEEVRRDVAEHPRIHLGIRPEDIEIVESIEGDHDFETVVDVVEPMGNENSVYLSFSAEDDHAFVAMIGGMRSVRAGQSVVARIPESAIHLFDAVTGEAIRNRSVDRINTDAPRL
jgi:multiple sugar transport system ATP-binding protein